MQSNSPIHIAIISIPTSGHVHVLAKMAHALKNDQPNFHIKWILTSWPDFELNPQVKELISNSCDELLILQGETPQGLALFERAYELTDKIIEQCRDCGYIIYDFLSPEGYLAGKALNIPAICTNPAIIGPFDPSDGDFINALNTADPAIKQLEKKYAVNFKDKIQYISAALSIQSDELNLIFSWPSLINIGKFKHNREHYSYQFMRSDAPMTMDLNKFNFILEKKAAGKKIVYFSLGTIATSISNNDLLDFFVYLYDCLIEDFGNDGTTEVILSFGDKAKHISSLRPVPPNFHIYSYLPQEALLQSGYIDAFITHGGGNGANEAIDSSIPMIVIPLMHDQHLCGENIEALGIGINFAYLDNMKPYFRESISPGVLKKSVNDILSLPEFSQSLKEARAEKPLPFTALPEILMSAI